MTACASPQSDAGDPTSARETYTFRASQSTREALGIAQWSITSSKTEGYDVHGHVALSFQYTVTKVAANRIADDLELLEHGFTSRVSATLDDRGDGTAVASNVQRDIPDPEAGRSLSFLHDDLKAEIAHPTVQPGGASTNVLSLRIAIGPSGPGGTQLVYPQGEPQVQCTYVQTSVGEMLIRTVDGEKTVYPPC
jgi:hypothetical protein